MKYRRRISAGARITLANAMSDEQNNAMRALLPSEIPLSLDSSPETSDMIHHIMWDGRADLRKTIDPTWIATAQEMVVKCPMDEALLADAERKSLPPTLTPGIPTFLQIALANAPKPPIGETLEKQVAEQLRMAAQEVRFQSVKLTYKGIVSLPMRDIAVFVTGNITRTYVPWSKLTVREVPVTALPALVERWPTAGQELQSRVAAHMHYFAQQRLYECLRLQLLGFLWCAKTPDVAWTIWPRVGLIANFAQWAPELADMRPLAQPKRHKSYRTLLEIMPMDEWRVLTAHWEQLLMTIKLLGVTK